MNKRHTIQTLFLTSLLCLSIHSLTLAQGNDIDFPKAQIEENDVSALYIGGHIRRERPQTIENIRSSGFSTAILFNVTVEEDGTLTTDGETICKDGEYVFDVTQPFYVSDIHRLKEQPTSVSRIEICIGGWGDYSYENIKELVNKHGTSEGTMLYRNFKALKDVLPEIDAVNNDDEYCLDLTTTTEFHLMMQRLGYLTTISPYSERMYWTKLAGALAKNDAFERIYLQCYDGGAMNSPNNWHLVRGIPVFAGLTNYGNDGDLKKNLAKFEKWSKNSAANGGFVWVYNDETWDLNQWAAGINRIFHARRIIEGEVAALVYSLEDYDGYQIELPKGEYNQAALALWGIARNGIASVKVAPGYQLTIFTEDNFEGECQTFSGDCANLGQFKDKASSLKIEYDGQQENGINQTYSDFNPTPEILDQRIYDLTGRIVTEENIQPGIYIRWGKKFIVR